MKINLTYKEAHLVMCVLHELGFERATVTGTWEPLWRLTDKGAEIARTIMEKVAEANAEAEEKSGKDRDLSGGPKGSIQEARWSK